VSTFTGLSVSSLLSGSRASSSRLSVSSLLIESLASGSRLSCEYLPVFQLLFRGLLVVTPFAVIRGFLYMNLFLDDEKPQNLSPLYNQLLTKHKSPA
jgi:hypothetical protein